MIKKFVSISKHLILGVGIIVGIVSCENEIENTGVDLVNNDIFHADKYVSEVIAHNNNIEKNQTNGLASQLLGVQSDANFGKLKASIITQLLLPVTNPDYGTEAVIDTIILDIPFSVTSDGTDDLGKPKFIYDQVWTSGNAKFQLNVFELGTYLNANDLDDPTKAKKYFSDDVFIKSQPLFSGEVSPSLIDTMMVIKRYKHPNYPSLTDPIVYKLDTITAAGGVAPSLKIPLDEAIFKDLFQDYATGSEFASQANFQHHFKGLYLEALEAADLDDAALLSLDLVKATVKIYYTNTTEEDEGEDEDLNGNDITGETAVTVHNPELFSYPLSINAPQTAGGGVKINLFERDYTEANAQNYLVNPNNTDGEDKLFLSGATGSNVILKLFGDDDNGNGIPDDLDYLRTKEWLINDAILTFYIDESNMSEDDTVASLFIYSIGAEENTQIYNSYRGGMGGLLETDGDEDDPQPVKYSIHIVDYITEIMKPDTDLELLDIGIKTMEITDLPPGGATEDTDTTLSTYSNNHKGVVVKGNLPSSEEKRIKLEIFYSEKN